jgi:hypothetical protein
MGRGSKASGGKIFRTRPDRPRCLPSGQGVVWPKIRSRATPLSPFVHSWHVVGRTLPFSLFLTLTVGKLCYKGSRLRCRKRVLITLRMVSVHAGHGYQNRWASDSNSWSFKATTISIETLMKIPIFCPPPPPSAFLSVTSNILRGKKKLKGRNFV